MERSLDILKTLLSKAGLKVTSSRLLVFKAVTNEELCHPNAEMIFDLVKKQSPSISLATVYKNLESLEKASLIDRVWSSDGQKRYDVKQKEHAHIHCTNTKEILDYHDQELNDMIINYFRKKRVNNLKIRNISLHITGEKIDPDKKVNIK